jgi:hypothetical protein
MTLSVDAGGDDRRGRRRRRLPCHPGGSTGEKGDLEEEKIGEDFVTLEQYKHGLVGFSKKKTRVDWK